eukprot:SAG31_NODE_417_length_15907_cov_6.901759_9_plen_113_part_00
MFVAAIAHRWVFSYKDFKSSDSSCPNQGFLAAFTDALSIQVWMSELSSKIERSIPNRFGRVQDVQSETSSLVQEVADAGRNVASAVSDEVTSVTRIVHDNPPVIHWFVSAGD